MSNADEIVLRSETQFISNLAESLDFCTENLPSILEFASEPDEKNLDIKVSIIAKLNLALPCLIDMALIAYTDGDFSDETEGHYLSTFAKEWGIDEFSLSRIKTIAMAIYDGNFECAEAELDKEWPFEISNMKDLRSWVATLKTSNSPKIKAQVQTVSSIEKQTVAMAEPININTSKPKRKRKSSKANAEVARIDSFKVDVLSQLGKLNQLLEKIRVDNESGSNTDEFQSIAKGLQSEITKVSDLRMTLAFVGTMKAGKSTTINAIVGSNVLPNRSGAMTTLPTLITHTQGNTEPILNFTKKKPFDDAIKKIKKHCNTKRIKEAPKGVLFGNTLDRIIKNQLSKLRTKYKGQKEIYSFMESMNDIARICAEYELESPLASYTSVGDFPEIEVEFAYLADREGNCAGKLSLVDTPGPNEAGQSGLKGVVKEQLAKASAIVCVAEHTQMDSEAQAEVRDWIQGAQKTSGAPLFVLINKIDNLSFAERSSDFFMERALWLFPDFDNREGNSVSVKGRVYGISSRQALLANMASNSLRIKGRLPNCKNDEWVMDFLEKGGGGQKDSLSLEDTNWIAECSHQLWDDSKMQQPMDEIILHSMHQAVPLCLGHALDFISRNVGEVQNAASVRQGALGVEVKELDALAQTLGCSIKKIANFQQELASIGVSVLGDFKKKLTAAMSKTQKDAMAALKKDTGKKEERRSNGSWRNLVFKSLSATKKDSLRNIFVENEEIIFKDKSDADKFVSKVSETASTVMRKVVDHSLSECENYLKEKRQGFGVDVESKIKPILSDISAILSDNFDFTMPTMKMPETKLVLDLDIASQAVVRTETRDDYYEERNPWTLWLCKRKVWFKVTEHKVDPRNFRQELERQFADYSAKASELLHKTIGAQFNNDLSKHIKAVNSMIARVQNSIEQALEDKELAEEKQEKTKKYFALLAKDGKTLEVRTCKVKGALNNMMEAV
jgi:GTPase SAR1 family protein